MAVDAAELPDAVVIHAMSDPVYLEHLSVCRGDREFLRVLFREAE